MIDRRRFIKVISATITATAIPFESVGEMSPRIVGRDYEPVALTMDQVKELVALTLPPYKGGRGYAVG